ncbi:MAG: DUF3325 domain-containing protein [Sphingobium sp.]
MENLLLLIAAFVLEALGFAMIAFSQKQHWPWPQCSESARRPAWLRLLGASFLTLAMIPAVLRDGLAFGLLLWIGMITVSALAVIACLVRLKDVDNPPR